MIKLTDEKIGTREFIAIIMLSIGLKLAGTTPSILYEHAKSAAWIIPFFYIFTVGIPLLLLISLIKKYRKGLLDLIDHLAGKVFGSILCFILFIITFLHVLIENRNYVDITNTLFYPKTPLIILAFILAFTAFFVSNRGLKAIANGSWLMTPVFQITLAVLLFITWKDANWMRIFPLAGPGIGTLLKESVNYSVFFSEIILLAAFFPFVRSYKNYRFATFFGFGITLFQMALFLALYVMVFDYPSTVLMRYPFQELTRIAEFGPSLNHIEGAFFVLWLIAAIFRLSIYIYLSSFLLGKFLNVESFEKLLLPLTGLIAFAGLLTENTFTYAPMLEAFTKVSSVIYIALPFLLWLLSKLKGKENEKRENAYH